MGMIKNCGSVVYIVCAFVLGINGVIAGETLTLSLEGATNIEAINKNSAVKVYTRWQAAPKLSLGKDGEYLHINSDAAVRPVVMTFDKMKLAPEVGSTVSVSFDLRILPGKPFAGELFVFGLYNSNKTRVRGNGSALSDNDYGYMAGLRRTSGKATIRKETGSDAIIFSGKDIAVVNNGGVNFKLAASDRFYKIAYTIRRTSAGVHITLSVDGKEIAGAAVLEDAYTVFDEFALSSTRSATEYDVKNIILRNTSAK